jgi:hypothetical protein
MTQDGQQNLDRLVFDSSYGDLPSFESAIIENEELGQPIPADTDPVPQDAQSKLDDLLRIATEQDEYIGIINRPHPSGSSSFFVIKTGPDTTVGTEQVITPTVSNAIPFVHFDLESHDVYSALTVAHATLVSY